MANSNFIVQNGLTVGPTTIFAGNGDIVTSGNVTSTATTTIFTTEYVTTLLNANATTDSTSTSTGAIVTAGGIGVAKAVTVGTTLTATTVNAATIGNSGATLTGTLSTASQPNITTLAGVTSIGASGSTTLTGTLQTAAQTNVTSVGTLAGLTVSAAIVPNANATVNLGSTSAWWNNIYGTATHALYADLAENYQADKYYVPGTVLMFGGLNEVTLADADTTRVAGVVSTNPAHLMNGGLQGSNVAPLALMGRVPCQVIGPVAKGDLLVSAGFGYAKSNNSAGVGQVIGKALYDFPAQAKGVIEVVVGRV